MGMYFFRKASFNDIPPDVRFPKYVYRQHVASRHIDDRYKIAHLRCAVNHEFHAAATLPRSCCNPTPIPYIRHAEIFCAEKGPPGNFTYLTGPSPLAGILLCASSAYRPSPHRQSVCCSLNQARQALKRIGSLHTHNGRERRINEPLQPQRKTAHS